MRSSESGDREPRNLAAVDLGSNSFHLIAARYLGGHLQIVDRIREMVRLGRGVNRHRRLSAAAMVRALDCLGRFAQRLAALSTHQIRIVGTDALRRAHNAPGFISKATETIGHNIEIISGQEEARLIYAGVTHSLGDDPRERRLVVDIGGGSTELIAGHGRSPKEMSSIGLGCVSVSEAFFPAGRVTSAAMEDARAEVARALVSRTRKFREHGWDVAIGSSGTVHAVQDIVRTLGWSIGTIERSALGKLIDALIAAGNGNNFDLAPVTRARAPVLPGGVAILSALFDSLGVERMSVSEGALREGLLYDLVSRNEARDIRDWTVASLLSRYNIDAQQAENVRDMALSLLHDVRAAWDLSADGTDADLLRWAAMLHEIGLDIAHSQHHKHGGYLLQHLDMPGFSMADQDRLAVLVRGHRRKISPMLLARVPQHELQRHRYLLVLLRIAAILQRGRSKDPIRGIKARSTTNGLHLEFPSKWLETHPLTQIDLVREANWLRVLGIRLSTSQVCIRTLEPRDSLCLQRQ